MGRVKRVDVLLDERDLDLLDRMQAETGFSRSKLVRLAIRLTYGDARAQARAGAELSRSRAS